MSAHRLAKAEEIAPGQMRLVRAGELGLALCNVDGTFYAVENRCSHDDGPLGEGTLRGAVLECPRHGALFDVHSGAALRMPAVVGVRVFPVSLKDGDVYVELP